MRSGLLTVLAAAFPAMASAQQPAAAPQPANWAVYRDPNENAFTVQVPAGWLVAGGLLRVNMGGTLTALEMRSPDGTIQIGLNDKDLPNFILPVPMYTQLGMQEGANVDNGAILAAYRSGQDFAAEYGQRVYGPACGHPLKVLEQATDEAAGQHAVQGNPIPGATASVGDAVLQCETPQHGFFGIVLATTTRMPFSTGGGMWTASPVVRVAVTDQAHADVAMQAMTHMLQTLEMNPQWTAAMLAAQRQAQAAQPPPAAAPAGPSIAAINSDLADYRRRVMNHVNDDRRLANDRVQRDVVDTINGTQRLADPATGRSYAAPYGYNSYSLGPNNTVLGTMGPGPTGMAPLNRTNN